MQLIEAALRVVACHKDDLSPDPADIRVLLNSTTDPEMALKPEALAAKIIKAELERIEASRNGGAAD